AWPRLKWTAHQRLFARAKNFIRENEIESESGRQRIVTRAQKFSAAAGESSQGHDQRTRSHHRRRFDRQFASRSPEKVRRSDRNQKLARAVDFQNPAAKRPREFGRN